MPQGLLIFEYTNPYTKVTSLGITVLTVDNDLEHSISFNKGRLVTIYSNGRIILIERDTTLDNISYTPPARAIMSNIDNTFIADGSATLRIIRCPVDEANAVMNAIYPAPGEIINQK